MPLQEVTAGDDRALQDIADLLVKSHKVVVITGAGISTSCGIPDFRSKDGLYNLIPDQGNLPTPPPSEPSTPSRKRKAYTSDDDELPSSSQSSTNSRRSSTPVPKLKGQDLFDSRVWSNEGTVEVFYQFIASLRQKIRGDVKETSFTHKFIRTLRDGGRLMRCYTQNIDGLEAREGLRLDMASGRGNKRRFMKKNYEAPMPAETFNTDFDGGCEVVQLHGDLDKLRCSLCHGTFEWTEESTRIYLEGQAPECETCCDKSDKRQATGKRGLSVGTLRPNIVLYGEDHPSNHLLAPLVPFDIASGPEALIIMGTSLKVFGLQKIVRDFAKAVHSRKDGKGRVIFINRTRPAESVWEGIIDDYVAMECDEWVQDLRIRREDLWLRQGELDLKVTKSAVKRKRKSVEGKTDNRPVKKCKITVEIPGTQATQEKSPKMDIASILNPKSPTPKKGPRPQLQHLADLTLATPSRSRSWKDNSWRTKISSSAEKRIMSAVAQRARPQFSPIVRSFKPLILAEMTNPPASPDRPQWSPIMTPSFSPLKRQIDVFRDPEDDAEVEIPESDHENDKKDMAHKTRNENDENETPQTPSKSPRGKSRTDTRKGRRIYRTDVLQKNRRSPVLGL